MPRPNAPRTIASERGLARRVAHERETRGMSYEALASRMTSVGCAINATAIYKIEKADPPRRITVDELVAFSEVFGVPVQELLLPPELAAKQELVRLMVAWDNARSKAAAAKEDEDAAWGQLRAYVDEHSDLHEPLEAALNVWSTFYFAREQQGDAVAYWMWKATHSDEWAARVREGLKGD